MTGYEPKRFDSQILRDRAIVAAATVAVVDRPEWMLGARDWIRAIATRADALLRARQIGAALQMAAKLNYAEPVITEGRLLLIEIYRRAVAIDPAVRLPAHYHAAARCTPECWAKVQTAALAYVNTASEAPSWSWLGRAARHITDTPDTDPTEYAARTHEQREADRAIEHRKAKARDAFNERSRGLDLNELVDHVYRLLEDTDEPLSIPDLYELASTAAKHSAFAEAIIRRVELHNTYRDRPRIDIHGGLVLGLADEPTA